MPINAFAIHSQAKEIPTGPTLSLEKKAPLQQKLPPVYFPLPNSEGKQTMTRILHADKLVQKYYTYSGLLAAIYISC